MLDGDNRQFDAFSSGSTPAFLAPEYPQYDKLVDLGGACAAGSCSRCPTARSCLGPLWQQRRVCRHLAGAVMDATEENDDDIPYVAVGAGQRAPWADEPLTCPECGASPPPLLDSDPPGLRYITH